MWTYNKILQYPINIKCKDPRLAKVIISQYGGPDGELAASLRYLSQRFGMPDQNAKAKHLISFNISALVFSFSGQEGLQQSF